MQGDVRVESKLGEGATFIFTIETQQMRGPLRPYMQREVFDFLGKRLLVVDHVAARREIRHYRYKRWGFDVITVGPDDAAATLRSKPGIDIVITEFAQHSHEAEAFQAALAANDSARMAQRDKRIISLLLSGITRTDLARQNIVPAVRHDFFLVRPVNVTKLFDALMRAVLGELGVDKSSRPFSPLSERADPVDAMMTTSPSNALPALTRVPATYQPQPTTTAVKSTNNASAGFATDANGQNITDREAANNERVLEANSGAHARGNSARGNKATTTRSYKVLVAEDNEVNQRVIGGMLRNLGHQIKIVDDGQAAVDAATRDYFDVILMDIQMPVLDGTTAMREIRAHFARADGPPCPPIVAMTAHALAGDRETYLADGMDDYLSKPIRSVEVAAVLERTAGQLPQASENILDARLTGTLPVASVKPLAPPATIVTPPKAPTPAAPPIATTPAPPPSVMKTAVKAAAKPAMFARSDLAMRIDQLPLLDIEQLEDLRYLPATPGAKGDASDPVGGLIRLFQSKAVERMDIIETCLANREWKALSDVAHSLRGASASMGFPRVAALCKDLELASRQLAEANAAAADGSAQTNANTNATKSPKLASQSELDEIFELTRYYYNQADAALREWLAAPTTTSTPPGE
jgi:CheY-like chemotaxis protein/HPt (histidine-containing phosphotransfer) domain-containing protein